MRDNRGRMNNVSKSPIIILFTGHAVSSWLTSLLGNHESITQLGFEPIDDFVLQDIEMTPKHERVFQDEKFTQFTKPVRNILTKNYESVHEHRLYEWSISHSRAVSTLSAATNNQQ